MNDNEDEEDYNPLYHPIIPGSHTSGPPRVRVGKGIDMLVPGIFSIKSDSETCMSFHCTSRPMSKEEEDYYLKTGSVYSSSLYDTNDSGD